MRKLPFTLEKLESIVLREPDNNIDGGNGRFRTPFHLYDEKGIRETARAFNNAFGWVPGGFKNYFAVKACPNPYILEILKEEGFGADCSSLPELQIAEAVGLTGEDIMFTSNDTPTEEFKMARAMGAIINLDDISHIPFLEKHAGIPEMICFRYNPGKEKVGNAIIGQPAEAKYGLTKKQIFEAYKIMRDKGVESFGIHTMVVSNELDVNNLIHTADMMFRLAEDISKKVGIEFEFINLGGGVGIPYKPKDKAVDLQKLSDGIKDAYSVLSHKPRVVMECGRAITGPHGYLVSAVRHVARKHKDYVGLDACMANLMRPALYGAYHHISVPEKEGRSKRRYDVTGSLCENNDKFAIDRMLPVMERGDLVVIHNAGAHGHAMGFNYNGKLRSAELLLKEDGSVKMIRREETPADYFATLGFPGSRFGVLSDR